MADPNLHHRWWEDALALALGATLIALGLAVLRGAGLVTGGMAGLALLVAHVVPVAPGVIFAALNLPFFLLAMRAMGGLFTARTLALSIAIAGLSMVLQQTLTIDAHQMAMAAVVGGVLLGMGTLSAIRHGTGVGGVGIVTIWLARSRGWNIARTQILIDMAILGASAFFLPWRGVLGSLASALAMGAVVFLWHRPGRYLGISQDRHR